MKCKMVYTYHLRVEYCERAPYRTYMPDQVLGYPNTSLVGGPHKGLSQLPAQIASNM